MIKLNRLINTIFYSSSSLENVSIDESAAISNNNNNNNNNKNNYNRLNNFLRQSLHLSSSSSSRKRREKQQPQQQQARTNNTVVIISNNRNDDDDDERSINEKINSSIQQQQQLNQEEEEDSCVYTTRTISTTSTRKASSRGENNSTIDLSNLVGEITIEPSTLSQMLDDDSTFMEPQISINQFRYDALNVASNKPQQNSIFSNLDSAEVQVEENQRQRSKKQKTKAKKIRRSRSSSSCCSNANSSGASDDYVSMVTAADISSVNNPSDFYHLSNENKLKQHHKSVDLYENLYDSNHLNNHKQNPNEISVQYSAFKGILKKPKEQQQQQQQQQQRHQFINEYENLTIGSLNAKICHRLASLKSLAVGLNIQIPTKLTMLEAVYKLKMDTAYSEMAKALKKFDEKVVKAGNSKDRLNLNKIISSFFGVHSSSKSSSKRANNVTLAPQQPEEKKKPRSNSADRSYIQVIKSTVKRDKIVPLENASKVHHVFPINEQHHHQQQQKESEAEQKHKNYFLFERENLERKYECQIRDIQMEIVCSLNEIELNLLEHKYHQDLLRMKHQQQQREQHRRHRHHNHQHQHNHHHHDRNSYHEQEEAYVPIYSSKLPIERKIRNRMNATANYYYSTRGINEVVELNNNHLNASSASSMANSSKKQVKFNQNVLDLTQSERTPRHRSHRRSSSLQRISAAAAINNSNDHESFQSLQKYRNLNAHETMV